MLDRTDGHGPCSMYPGIPRMAADRIATAFVRERVIRLNNRIKYVD